MRQFSTQTELVSTLDQVGGWVAVIVAALLAALGIRLRASRVKDEVARNEAHAQHSSGLVEDLSYWRASTERAYEQIRMLEVKCASLEAKVALRDERIERLETRCERLTRFVISREPTLAVWLRSEPGDLSEAVFIPPPERP